MNVALLVTCVVAALLAGALVAETAREGAAYSTLSGEAATDGIDWDSLGAQNPDIAAWVKVDGTPIDYPVVNTRAGDEEGFYLNHDFWRNRSGAGCLYLDARCRADGPHALVYGHHMGFTGQMFSPIFDTYEQEKFDAIGDMTWSTPDLGDTTLAPAFALSVDKTYDDIQTFDFTDAAELRTWLAGLSSQASAKADDCDGLCASATRVVTLVTCSSVYSGQRARTLLVFVG